MKQNQTEIGQKQKPFYRVDIHHGRLGSKNPPRYRYFTNDDLNLARRQALQFAWKTEKSMQGNFDDPSLVTDTPALIPMLIAFSLGVHLIVDKNESHQIYGESGYDNLGGLSGEAGYYLQEKLIDPKELAVVIENATPGNGDEPDYVFPELLDEYPIENCINVTVLPYDLKNIITESVAYEC